MTNKSEYQTLKTYVSEQRKLIKLDCQLAIQEIQNTAINNIDLNFIRQSDLPSETKRWTTTLHHLDDFISMRKPPILYVSDIMHVDFLDSEKPSIEGIITKIQDNEIKAVFKLDCEDDLVTHKCNVQFKPNNAIIKLKLNSLNRIKYLNPYFKNIICQNYPKRPKKCKIKLLLPENIEFDKSQKSAIRLAFSTPFTIIRGPAGSGKTYTTGGITIQALKSQPNKKVLLCGSTKQSTMNILEIIGDMIESAGYKICCICPNIEHKLTTLYQSLHMDTTDGKRFKELYEKTDKTNQERMEMEMLKNKLEEQIIQQSNVIVSTVFQCGKKTMKFNKNEISTLIVDEANSTTDSYLFIPLSHCPDRFILVGDHKQIKPVGFHDELNEKDYYNNMFLRIINSNQCLNNTAKLNTQHRMQKDISGLSKNVIYTDEEDFIDGVPLESRKIDNNKLMFQNHLNFINFDKEKEVKEEKKDTSYINTTEANYVLKFVTRLLEIGIDSSQIGVISFYYAQSQLISDTLEEKGIHIKVGTTDAFQGDQKEYIIFCTTKCKTGIGFVQDISRINLSITRALNMATIFGSAELLSNSSPYWAKIIEYTKSKNSFCTGLLLNSLEKKVKEIFSEKKQTFVNELVIEFKEEDLNNVGYNLHAVKSMISNCDVPILWPDEEKDKNFLKKWVSERVQSLDNNFNVTLSYDAENVCLQFGDVFDRKVDYYNWNSNEKFPKIKTNESIIVSFYNHKGDYRKNLDLVNLMKPLLEHPKITLITFDFTYDLDKLYKFGINLTTTKIIDTQLMDIPNESDEDFIRSTNVKAISDHIDETKDDHVNTDIISRARKNIINEKKIFPHGENKFLIKQFNYPKICNFTKLFLEYSAEDIFYTAITGINVLAQGKLEDVKNNSLNKLKCFNKHRINYGRVSIIRSASFNSKFFKGVMGVDLCKVSYTGELLKYYGDLSSYLSLIKKCPGFINKSNTPFTYEDGYYIYQKYLALVQIMKNPNNSHMGYIKDTAILAYVDGILKVPASTRKLKNIKDIINQENKIEPDEAQTNIKTPVKKSVGGITIQYSGKKKMNIIKKKP